MTRRELIASAIVLPVAGVLAGSRRYGYMDVDRWFAEGHQGKSVFLNGRDITDGCVWFNDITGRAECWKRNANGEFYCERVNPEFVFPERIASEILHGHIEVR